MIPVTKANGSIWKTSDIIDEGVYNGDKAQKKVNLIIKYI